MTFHDSAARNLSIDPCKSWTTCVSVSKSIQIKILPQKNKAARVVLSLCPRIHTDHVWRKQSLLEHGFPQWRVVPESVARPCAKESRELTLAGNLLVSSLGIPKRLREAQKWTPAGLSWGENDLDQALPSPLVLRKILLGQRPTWNPSTFADLGPVGPAPPYQVVCGTSNSCEGSPTVRSCIKYSIFRFNILIYFDYNNLYC